MVYFALFLPSRRCAGGAKHSDHLIVIASGACMSTSDSNVDFQTHPRKQAFINSRIQP